MRWVEGGALWEPKKNEYTCGNNISRICLENPPKLRMKPITKIISNLLDIKLGQFTQELNVILRKIENRKAAGLDGKLPEVWKTRKFDYTLLRRCNPVYNQNIIDGWTTGCIHPFPKKGNFRIAKNYRGITLTSIAAKILTIRRIL